MGGKYTLIINVLNKDLVPVTFIDNDIPGLPSYYKDTLIDYLSLGTASFEFTILKSKNNIIQDYSRFFNDETCFSFEKNGKQYAVFPAGSDGFYETDTEITYKCLSLDRELSLEYVDKFDNSSTHTLQWYIDYFELISNNQIEIGRNDVADYTRVIKYDSQDTKLNRLLSLINNFDAEFEFITKLTNNGAVDKIILNIVKKRDDSGKGGIGAIRDDVELVYGKNVKGIERTYNFEFFNASKVIGKDGTNWNSSEFSYINSDGVEEFYKRKNDDTAFAPLSAQKYPAHLRKDSSDIWLRKNFETEYTTPAQMWGYIVQQFKSYAYPQITYKIKTNSNLVSQALDGKLPIQIGDTVTIEDDNFSNEQGDFGLILRARATEIKSSDSNPETNEITFENFVELQNDLSDDLMTQVNQLVDAATPFRAELSTTNGTQFKNGTGSTTLSAHIFKGSATTETVADSYEWSKDGTVVAPTQTITVDASGVADKAVYSFKATVAGKVVASQSVTITNVDDGTNGRSVTNVSQKWRLTTTTATPTQAWSDAGWLTTQPTTTATNKYLWSITRTTFNLAPLTQDVIEQKAVYGDKGDKGDTGNDGRAGKDGVGLRSTTVTYTISSSGTVTPTTGWTSQVPTLVKEQHLWTKTLWTYTDNTSETGYSVSYIAKDGNNGTNGIAGKDGVGISNTIIEYVGAVSGTSKPTGGWSTTIPTVPAGQYLWTRTTWQYTDGTSEQGYINALMGLTGASGRDGIAGKDGKGIKATAITYQASTNGTTAPTGTWSTSVPSVAKGSFLWTRTIWTYTDNTTETGYAVAYMGTNGNNGTNGIAGKDGVGITATTITYAQSTSGTIAPSSGWTSTVPTVAEGSYLWTKTVWTYSDSTSETGYSVAMNGKTPYFYTAWSYSADGTDGFTTVYPNLNLLVNSSAKTKDGFFKNFDKVEDGYGEVTLKGNNSYAGISMWDGFSIQPGDYKPGDTYTMSMDVMFTSWNFPAGVYLEEFWIGQRYTHNSDWSINSWKRICYIDLPKDPSKMLNQWIRITYTSTIPPHEDPSVHTESIFLTKFSGSGEASFTLRIRKPKQEPGSTATPHMPSASEVTTADWPSYIGQYTDFTQADSTKPSDYTWSLIRGNDGKDGANGKDGLAGKDGVGIKTTVITYAISISGTIAPTTGWTSSVPSLVKGQYLWTKTVWTYTDNSFETGYSVTYISKDGNNGNDGIAGKDGTGIKTTTITYAGSTSGTTAPTSGWTSTVPMVEAGSYLWTKTVWAYTDNTSETGYSVAKMGSDGAIGPQGPQGNTGPQGPAGSNGDPGKTVSNTEPSTRFKGLTWKYSGTTDLTASDGTVIKPNTEYYYNGTHWVINYFSVNNFAAESITSDKIDGKNLTITDGEFVSTTTNGPVTTSTEIKDNHIAISKTDGTVNTRNDIALDSEQGLAQKFTNINTGFYRTAG
ncbi:hypothetical protein, partial [Lactococcus lactis]